MGLARRILRTLRWLVLGVVTTVAIAWSCSIFVSVPGDIYGSGPRAPYDTGREYVLPPDPNSVTTSPTPHAAVPSVEVTGPSVHAAVWRGFGSLYIMSGTNSMRVLRSSGCKPIIHIIPAEVRSRSVPWFTGDAAFPADDTERFVGARGWPCLALWCDFRARVCSTALSAPAWMKARKSDLLGEPVGGIALPWPHVTPDWHSEPPPPLTALPCRPLWRGLTIDTLSFALFWWGTLCGPGAVRRRFRKRRGRCPHCGYDLRATPAGSPCPECGTAFYAGTANPGGITRPQVR
jgi:hypothetical protein